jgi:hypothetical protein
MTSADKDTIYIDIDDEITTIIDKLRASGGKVVALVLPKRATTLQSIVNMKLLKRAAEESKKNLVLVTTESGLMPLAGAVGLHVASTPNSRPEVPIAPGAARNDEEQVDEIDFDDEPTRLTDSSKTVGELAGAAAMPLPKKPAADNGIETLELDNADPTPVAAASTAAAKPVKRAKKDKKLAIPNFDRFRVLLVAGGVLLVALIVFGYLAFAVLPKASINIKTNASNVNTDIDLVLSTAATSLSESSKTLPAKQAQVQKTLTGNAPATGQKNNGDKAQGDITMTLCTNSPGATNSIPAGTGVSSGSKTYITQESATFQYNGNCNGGFRFRAQDVSIAAQTGGASFNVNNADFKVSGRSDISANGSATGGTDDIQTVISQSDIDAAKAKIQATDNGVQDELKGQLDDDGVYAVEATFNAGEPTTTNSAQVGDESSSVTVTQVITYTMLGVKENDLKTLVDNDIKSQIDTSQQGILSQGINQSGFKLTELTARGANMNLQTTAEVGPSINTDAIAQDAAGKKSSEIKASIQSNPDVTDVEVKLSPFWVTKAPKASKITVTVAKPTRTANAN